MKKNVVIIILLLAVIGSVGYIGYDKIYLEKNKKNQNKKKFLKKRLSMQTVHL